MKIEREDLDAAIAAGVVTQSQADALRTFVIARNQTRGAQLGSEDEHFRFMRGFNDFFFAIGILLLGFGIAFFAGGYWAYNVIAAAAMWGLSEGLVGRMRLVLPGILLSVFFVVFAYMTVPFDISALVSPYERLQLHGDIMFDVYWRNTIPAAVVAKAPIAVIAAALYYWRFRLPFTLLPIAGLVVMVVAALASLAIGPLTPGVRALVTLMCGVAVFGVAMAFDISDRVRATRRSDCAFWLHLLAAPLIVHSIISLITSDWRIMSGTVSVTILVVILVLAFVAIVIDRRAMLVSTLLYVGSIVAYVLRNANLQSSQATGQEFVFFATLLTLGLFVIALGVGWQPLRRLLLKLISPALAAKLPPAQMSV